MNATKKIINYYYDILNFHVVLRKQESLKLAQCLIMIKKTLLIFAIIILTKNCFSQTDSVYHQEAVKIEIDSTLAYAKPKKFGFITGLPQDLFEIAKAPLQKNNLGGLGTLIGSTALLYWQDRGFINNAQQFAKGINLDESTRFYVPIEIAGQRLVKIPKNLNTAFYQLGEGGSTMYIAAGLFIYGKINKDNRSLQTASDLTESFLTMGIATQILKRITGRQTPSYTTTSERGEWNFFPSNHEFNSNKPNYDSFPSGHLSTMMATVTVLAKLSA